MINSKKFYVYFCTMKREVCPTENEVNKLISCIIKKWGDSFLLLKVVVNLVWENAWTDLIQGLAWTKLSVEGGSAQALLPARSSKSQGMLSQGGIICQGSGSWSPDLIRSAKSQFSWGAIQLCSGHPTCSSSSRRGYLTFCRILPAPCSCQRKYSSTTALPSPSRPWGSWECSPATQWRTGERNLALGAPADIWLLPGFSVIPPPMQVWAAIKTSPHLPALKPSLPPSPLNHLPSIHNSANCWCFTKYMLRHSFKENPHSCKQ